MKKNEIIKESKKRNNESKNEIYSYLNSKINFLLNVYLILISLFWLDFSNC